MLPRVVCPCPGGRGHSGPVRELITIGEPAARTGPSRKALRLYDDRGLLRPVRVGPSTRFRYYAPDRVERALVEHTRATEELFGRPRSPGACLSGPVFALHHGLVGEDSSAPVGAGGVLPRPGDRGAGRARGRPPVPSSPPAEGGRVAVTRGRAAPGCRSSRRPAPVPGSRSVGRTGRGARSGGRL
ncbi:MerR family transcriptional regulator [Streptomyces bikiniensis]|uniref:MerR family transcriptional regulator n=1 Tax=Streptomyces bikiniensis TaxID=1896 RepID=UPI00389AB7DF